MNPLDEIEARTTSPRNEDTGDYLLRAIYALKNMPLVIGMARKTQESLDSAFGREDYKRQRNRDLQARIAALDAENLRLTKAQAAMTTRERAAARDAKEELVAKDEQISRLYAQSEQLSRDNHNLSRRLAEVMFPSRAEVAAELDKINLVLDEINAKKGTGEAVNVPAGQPTRMDIAYGEWRGTWVRWDVYQAALEKIKALAGKFYAADMMLEMLLDARNEVMKTIDPSFVEKHWLTFGKDKTEDIRRAMSKLWQAGLKITRPEKNDEKA